MRVGIYDLQPDTKYSVQLRSKSGADVSAWSRKFALLTISDGEVPPIPTNITFVAQGDTFIGGFDVVTTFAGMKGYEIEIKPPSLPAVMTSRPHQASGRITFEIPLDANIAIFGTAQPTLSIRVRSVSVNNVRSAWSAYFSAEKTGPAAPTNVVATVSGDTISLTWTAPAGEIAKYKVYASGTGTGFPVNDAINKIWEGQGTSYTYIADTYASFTFAVVAVDNFGLFSPPGYSNTVMTQSPFEIDTDPPPIPAGFSGSLVNNANGIGGKATLSWSISAAGTPEDNLNDLADFTVRYRKVGTTPYYTHVVNAEDYTGTTDNRSYTFVIDVPEAYVQYEFLIKSNDWSNNNSTSAGPLTLTPAAPSTPVGVTGLAGSPGRTDIRYTWTASTAADLKRYELSIANNSSFTGETIFKTGTATALTVGGLTPNTQYWARVRQVNTNEGVGAWSSSVNHTTTTDSTITTVSADMIEAGTLGGIDGSGVINIGLGTSFIFNGGYMKSNTYTGTTQATNPSGAGFYLGDDGIRIDTGKVSVAALESGTITTKTITLSGAGAIIQSSGYTGVAGTGGFRLSGLGLEIPDGSITAAKLQIQSGVNIVHPSFADFEWDTSTSTWYNDNIVLTNATKAWDTTNKKFNERSLQLTITTAGGGARFRTHSTNSNQFNIEPVSNYLVSMYLRATGGGTRNVTASLIYTAGGTQTRTSPSKTFNADGTWQRVTCVVNIPDTPTSKADFALNFAETGVVNVDGVQVEQKMSVSDVPSSWSPPSLTVIDGGQIITGSIQSNVSGPLGGPMWSIPLNGAATFQNLLVRGTSVVGVDGSSGAGSVLRSGVFVNPTSGGGSGWQLNSDGTAEFSNAIIKGTIVAADIQSGTFATNVYGNNRVLINTTSGAAIVRFMYGFSGEVESTAGGIGGIDGSGGFGTDYKLQLSSGIAPGRPSPAILILRPSLSGTVTDSLATFNGAVQADGSIFAQQGIQSAHNIIQTFGTTTLLNTTVNSLTANSDANINGVLFANAGAQIAHTTTAAAANTHMTNAGVLYRFTSSARYKTDIEDMQINLNQWRKIRPRQFKSVNSYDTNDKYYGFIAEELDDLGFKELVEYDENDRPEGVQYPLLTVVLQKAYLEMYNELKVIRKELDDFKKNKA